MLNKQKELIITIAQLLSKKRNEPGTLHTALSLICQEFAFDYALVYEVSQYNNCLFLTESYGVHQANTELAAETFSSELRDSFARESILYCRTQQHQTQTQLLSLFGAHSLVAISSVDEGGRIYGLIALCNASTKNDLDELTFQNLSTALSMLSDNVAVHVYQNRVRGAQTVLESILDNTGIDIYVNDFYNHDILYVNESMAKPYGGKELFMGRKCWEVLFPGQTGPCKFCPQKKLVDADGKPCKVYTWDYQRAFDGSWFRVFSASFRWIDGRLAHVVSSADITDNKRNEELIRYMANYDSLSKLPNRRKLVEECGQRISQSTQNRMYLLFFDIDGFKDINDNLGHDAGDEFLQKLGEFFMGIPMLKNSIYRNGGDEFVAMLGNNITGNHVSDLCRFIQKRFQNPWELKKGTIMSGVSIGVAQYPKDGLTAEELLQRADQAMYHVKKRGGGGMHFASDQE